MTHSRLILITGIMVLTFGVGDADARKKHSVSVKVVNEPNVNVLNNVDVNVTNDETNPVPVTVQNGDNNGSEKKLVEIVALDVPPQTTLAVYTVPSGMRLVITDVLINGPGSGHPMEILRDGTIVSRQFLGGTTYFHHSYVSGIEFLENVIVSVKNGQDLGDDHESNWELRGYQTDVNGS